MAASTLRILQVNNILEGAGVEVVISNLREHLDKESVQNALAVYQRSGHDHGKAFHIICPGKMLERLANSLPRPKISRESGAQPFSDPNKTLAKLASVKLRRWIPLNDPLTRISSSRVFEKYRPNLVHFHKIMPSLAPLDAAARMGLRTVITLHGYWPICPYGNLVRADGSLCHCSTWSECGQLCSQPRADIDTHMKRLQEFLVERTDLFVTVSDFVRSRMTDFGYPPEMIKTIHNGVEPFAGSRVEGVGKPTVLFCGRINKHKGIEVFLETARIARQERLELDFVVVGARERASSVQRLAGYHVNVMPWLDRDELTELMRKAMCIIIPSLWHEPLPLIALESLASGLPVIATRVGGIPEIVEDGLTGYLIDTGDMKAMARKILDRVVELAHSPELSERMSRRCIQSYQEEFRHETMGNRYLGTFSGLAGDMIDVHT